MGGSPSPPSVACLARCTLEPCRDDGCWLERVRVPEAIEALLQRLLDQVGPHLAVCTDGACLHFAHRIAAPGSGDRAA